MYKHGLLKKIGNKLNSIILRYKILHAIDRKIESIVNLVTPDLYHYSEGKTRRYRSFIGNNLITRSKYKIIESNIPVKLNTLNKIADIGCADGSLIFELSKSMSGRKIYGADSGYKNCFENRAIPDCISLRDLEIYHPYYNKAGRVSADDVDLMIPNKTELIIMYDVLPYLNETTIKNYFQQFNQALTPDGVVFITAKLNTLRSQILAGTGGEKTQDTIRLSELTNITSQAGFEIVNLLFGDWDKSRRSSTIHGGDVIIFRKV